MDRSLADELIHFAFLIHVINEQVGVRQLAQETSRVWTKNLSARSTRTRRETDRHRHTHYNTPERPRSWWRAAGRGGGPSRTPGAPPPSGCSARPAAGLSTSPRDAGKTLALSGAVGGWRERGETWPEIPNAWTTCWAHYWMRSFRRTTFV